VRSSALPSGVVRVAGGAALFSLRDSADSRRGGR
jgi:hypothetical protein